MASTFGTMAAQMLEEAQKPGKLTFAKRSIVAALLHYQGFRARFSEKKSTASLTAAADEVTPPADLLSIDSMYWTPADASRSELMEKVSLGRMREMKWNNATAGQPRYWTLHHDKIIVYPTPTVTGELLSIWYMFDATRDTATGNVITSASADAVTNEWFNTGEVALRYYALADFCVSCTADPEKASMYGSMALKAEADLLVKAARWKKPARVQSIW